MSHRWELMVMISILKSIPGATANCYTRGKRHVLTPENLFWSDRKITAGIHQGNMTPSQAMQWSDKLAGFCFQ
ncbi:MAG: hypothetical protein HOC85_11585 [Acidiferrobacteraceae bacterium]|nr:hypothetical protein [Acidiferrobacteraceae bacterium]